MSQSLYLLEVGVDHSLVFPLGLSAMLAVFSPRTEVRLPRTEKMFLVVTVVPIKCSFVVDDDDV